MVKLLCIVEVHGTNNVEVARKKLDIVRMQMTDNDITDATIYQVHAEDWKTLLGDVVRKKTIHIL